MIIKKYILFCLAAILLLAFSLLFFFKAYRELSYYVELTNRANAVHSCFQDLSKKLNKAAIMNPDLREASQKKGITLFSVDSLAIIQQLRVLKQTVKDSINIKIASRLDVDIRSELSWLLKSNIADSIVKQNISLHLLKLQRIDSLINKGIERTKYLVIFWKQKLNETFLKDGIIIFLLIMLSSLVGFFTSVSLFKQRARRKAGEVKLLEKDQRYKHTLDLMREGVQILDFDWRFIYVNDALAKDVKTSKEELLKTTFIEKYPGVEKTNLFKTLQRCMNDRVSAQLDNEFVFPDGSKADFELSIQPVPEGLVILSVNVTERKKTAEKISTSEAKYRSVVENIHESLIIEDLKGNLIYANKEFQEMFGFHSEEFRNLSVRDYTADESYPEVIERHNNRIKGISVAEEFEYKGRRKDGTEIWVEARVSSILENGKIIGTQSLEKDITERKKAEENLIKANRLYAFISQINQSIVHINNKEDLLKKACEIAVDIGKFKTAWIGMLNQEGTLDMILISGDQKATESMRKYSGMDFTTEMLKDTPTGVALSTGQRAVSNDVQNDPAMLPWKEEFLVSGVNANISFPIKQFGKAIGVFGFSSVTRNFFDKQEIDLLAEAAGDISFALELMENTKKHQETELLLVHNEKRFRALIEKSVDMKTLTSREGKFIYCSPTVNKVFGYTEEEFLNKIAANFFHPDDLPEILKKRAKIMNLPGHSFTFRARLLHKNGTWIWCEGALTNMFHEPAINAFVSNFRDITEKKIKEEESEKMANDIIQRSKNLEQFAYIISHNLRAPIANILGMSNLLKGGVSHEDRSRIENFLFGAVEKLDEVVIDLNKILELRAGNNEKRETVNFKDLISDIRTSISNNIQQENAEIIIDFKNALQIDSIRSYMHSIFYNLILNSIKYRKPDISPVITITSKLQNDILILSFKDNGLGIDLSRHSEKIFKLYNRFHLNIQGKGLGLFMVKTQVEFLGGIIKVESQLGEGAEFIIEIPFTTKHEAS